MAGANGGDYMINTQERLQLVADVVAADLNERFANETFFDPIAVAPATSVYGDDYFRIIVVVRDGAVLDPYQLGRAGVNIRAELYAMDIPEFPTLTFVDKSDWLDPEGYDGGKRGVYIEGY